jgi:hypothetical protein
MTKSRHPDMYCQYVSEFIYTVFRGINNGMMGFLWV